MACVSSRIVPNLEVNAPLSSVLKQMADKKAPPPMMYDFHLASMLPLVFNLGDCRPLLQIFKLIRQFDIPHESIRFSLDESHDGKSVSGSGGADPLLTYEHRKILSDIVNKNGGHIKYKSWPKGLYPYDEFKKICAEAGLDLKSSANALFKNKAGGTEPLRLKESIKSETDIAGALDIDIAQLKSDAALTFFADKIINGREPYELCITTRDSLTRLDDPFLEAKRYIAFKTLSFALMGRHVKSVFFNDLIGLQNDHESVQQTGELRNIKRTKSDRRTIDELIGDPTRIEYWIAKQMNNTTALVDTDPSFHPRGKEARLVDAPGMPSVAFVHNFHRQHNTLVIVNTSGESRQVRIRLSDYGLEPQKDLIDNITGAKISDGGKDERITLEITAYGRFWIKHEMVEIARGMRVDVGTEADMKAALATV
jgi:hypothetical protein